MSSSVWLLRHGETEWTEHDLHTGRRDVPLSDRGREQARRAGRLIAAKRFDHVLVSPQTRALQTCELAGLGANRQTRAELVEWDYGEYEGLTDEQTEERQPGWELFRDGAPGGESPEQITVRTDRLLETVSALDGTVALVGHGKLLRAFGARWIGCSVSLGSLLSMFPAAISILEKQSSGPSLRLWNLTPELTPA